MRIGILTQPLTSNYGCILQNYALQQTLMKMGHTPITIDIGKYTWFNWVKDFAKYIVKVCLNKKTVFPPIPTAIKKENKPLRNFVKNNIKITRTRYSQLSPKIIRRNDFDAIIVGSDQVWRPKYNWKLLPDMFLRFAEKDNIRKIAYAASFGTDKWEFNKEQTSTCASLAKQFDAISVREESGVELCQEGLGVNAVHVLDPTLLLSKKDYLKLCDKVAHRTPFVLAYILDYDDNKIKEIVEFAKCKGLSYIIKSAGGKVNENDSIEDWLSLFRDAQFVITDSFHGTVFSIIFNKDFYVFCNPKRGNSRFTSLLQLVGLENRIVEDCRIPQEEQINWDEVNQLRKDKVVFSISFLEEALELERKL